MQADSAFDRPDLALGMGQGAKVRLAKELNDGVKRAKHDDVCGIAFSGKTGNRHPEKTDVEGCSDASSWSRERARLQRSSVVGFMDLSKNEKFLRSAAIDFEGEKFKRIRRATDGI